MARAFYKISKILKIAFDIKILSIYNELVKEGFDASDIIKGSKGI